MVVRAAKRKTRNSARDIDFSFERQPSSNSPPAFLDARGAPPPLAIARRLRASLGPQALLTPRLFSVYRQPSTAATTRSRSATSRLARAAGAADSTPILSSPTVQHDPPSWESALGFSLSPDLL